MRRTAALATALVWLCFTRYPSARADPARSSSVRVGPEARLGSAVGFSQLGDQSVSTLGGEVAIGYRFDRFTLEALFDDMAMLHYVEDRGSNTDLGRLERLGVSGRLTLARLARGRDPDSVLRLYVEGGAGREHGRWNSGQGFARTDLSGGAGWILDHRMRPRPGGLAASWLGWQFGWRVASARADRADAAPRVVCRTTSGGCPPPMPGVDRDLSLVVSSSFSVAW